MSDDLPAQACVVFCALFSWLSMLRRGDGVLSLSSCGDGVEGVARTSFTPRHRSVAFASIYATSAPSTRSNVLCRETPLRTLNVSSWCFGWLM